MAEEEENIEAPAEDELDIEARALDIEGPSLAAPRGELVDRAAATTESLPQMTNLEWGKAACSEDAIQECVAAGAFRPGELIEWRAPVKDETPTLSTLEDQFVILSLNHIICGLRLDASDFLLSVLSHCRIEWSHLTPNSITVMGMFAHLCEAYIEAPPTVEVFTHFYSLYRNMKGETTTLGSVYFRLRDKMKKKYPLYYLKANHFMWVSLWFYAKVPQSCHLTFRCDALEEKKNWKDFLPLSHEQENQVLKITELSNRGLSGADIVHDYLKHRISPLRRRTHLACDYSGLSDSTRDSDKDLSVEDIESKLSYLLDLNKMVVKQHTDRPNVPTSLVRSSANDHANQPLGLLIVPSTHESKKKALEEITASVKTREPSMITYKSPVRESLPQMTNLEWGKAACSEDAIKECVAAGAFHPGELIEWRAPVKDETVTLSALEDQFVVLSLTHIFCGLRLDASDFLASVLSHYRIEWSHLTPNSITTLSMFAHLCEAYMEVSPTVEVFTHFYSLYRNMKGETMTLGSVYFRLRDKMKKNYPLYYLKALQFMWVSLWFYAKVPQSCPLTFRCDALEEKNNWKDCLPLSREQEKQVLKITELSNKGLTGADIVHDYLKHRISPLRRRTHLACDYSGPSDPTRDSDKDLSVEDIESKLSYLLDLKKMVVKQPTDRPNVPTSLVRASVNYHANQALCLLNVPSTHEAKKKSLEEITASVKTRKPSMITYTYKSPVCHASVRRSTRQSAGPRKVVVPPPLEIDPSATQDSDPEEEIPDAITSITTAASPNQGIEQKTIEHPAEEIAELTKPAFSVIGAKRKASAP